MAKKTINKKEIKYFAYVRVSTYTQEKKGFGLQSQLDSIQKYVTDNKLHLPDEHIFIDDKVSGTTMDRDGLNDLFNVLEENAIVIVLNTSRLWRSDTIAALIKRKFIVSKIHVKSIEQPTYDLYTKDPNNFLLNGMIELLDQYDRMTINEKLARGRKQKSKNGVKGTGVAPLGYKWKHDGEVKPILVIHGEEKAIVEIIFKKYYELKSIGKVKNFLRSNRFLSRRGNEFADSSIYGILRNRFYIGELTWGELSIKGSHETFISKVMFGKVQAELDRKKRGGRPKGVNNKKTSISLIDSSIEHKAFYTLGKNAIEENLSQLESDLELAGLDRASIDAALSTSKTRLEKEFEEEMINRFGFEQ